MYFTGLKTISRPLQFTLKYTTVALSWHGDAVGAHQAIRANEDGSKPATEFLKNFAQRYLGKPIAT